MVDETNFSQSIDKVNRIKQNKIKKKKLKLSK